MRPTCKVCDSGTLKPRTVYRLSGVVALIGYIILIPSMLGICVGGLACVGMADAANDPALQDPEGSAAVLGVLGGGMMVFSLVGGLLGWLLILKKRVLRCTKCGATVAAS